MFSLNHYKQFVTRSEIKGGNNSEIKADKDSLEDEGGTTEIVCKSAKWPKRELDVSVNLY